ncbi:MAG: glycosyl hydrolase family 28-related protein [Alcanivorax jadensis]|uniref:glycosyl hydrolase family 28-related protein n=1 Tax=Alcanivorax jadensis TaxID=64988 RepID=UPI00300191F5
MAYNTGNPVGSRSPKDLLDNSENLDELVNSPTKETHPDRLGVDRKTWHGMEEDFDAAQVARQAEFDNDQADREAEWAATLAGAGYIGTGPDGVFEDYDADGPLTIAAANEIFTRSGEFYRIKPGVSLPYITTGTWGTDEADFVAVGDAALRSELAAPGGGRLVRDAVTKVANVTELRALPANVSGQGVEILDNGWSGLFRWDSSNLSSQVAADEVTTGEGDGGVYVAPASDKTGATGSWVRVFSGPVNLRWYGAKGDGTTDDTPAVKAAVLYCITNQKALFCPSGTYIIRPITDSGPVYLNKGITADGMGLTMYGEGRGKTIFKEGDGETEAGGRFTTMFYCWLDDPATNMYEYGTFSFADMTFDKNGRSNADPPTLYEWEGAHIMKFQGLAGTPGIQGVSFERIELIDKIGAGIVLGPSDVQCRSLTIKDVQSRVHPKLDGGAVGQKGCIEVAIDSALTVIESVNCRYSQIEPTFPYDAARRSNFKLRDSNIDIVEYTYTGTGVQNGNTNVFIDISGLTSSVKFLLRGVRGKVVNSTVKATTEFYNHGLLMDNCTILLPYDSGTFAVSGLYFNTPAGWNVASRAKLNNCEILIDSDTVDATTTGYMVRGGLKTVLAEAPVVEFHGCTFDPRGYGVHDAYSTGGNFSFYDCPLGSRSGGRTFLAGAYSSFKNRLVVRNCDYENALGDSFRVQQAATGYALIVSGEYPDGDITFSSNNAAAVLPAQFPVKPKLMLTAAPVSGIHFLGQQAENIDPSVDANDMIVTGWRCVASGNPGTWEPIYGSTVSPAT